MCFFSTNTLYSLENIVDTFNDGLISFFDNLGDKIYMIEDKVLEFSKEIDDEISNSIKNKRIVNKSQQTPIELNYICIVESDADKPKPLPNQTIIPIPHKTILEEKVEDAEEDAVEDAAEEDAVEDAADEEAADSTKTSNQAILFNHYFIEEESWDIINDAF